MPAVPIRVPATSNSGTPCGGDCAAADKQGHFVGTLCIADFKPRHLGPAQLELLHALRNLTTSE